MVGQVPEDRASRSQRGLGSLSVSSPVGVLRGLRNLRRHDRRPASYTIGATGPAVESRPREGDASSATYKATFTTCLDSMGPLAKPARDHRRDRSNSPLSAGFRRSRGARSRGAPFALSVRIRAVWALPVWGTHRRSSAGRRERGRRNGVPDPHHERRPCGVHAAPGPDPRDRHGARASIIGFTDSSPRTKPRGPSRRGPQPVRRDRRDGAWQAGFRFQNSGASKSATARSRPRRATGRRKMNRSRSLASVL